MQKLLIVITAFPAMIFSGGLKESMYFDDLVQESVTQSYLQKLVTARNQAAARSLLAMTSHHHRI